MGKVAYVTGGMGGIGTTICQRLQREGFIVVAGCGPSRDYQKWLAEQRALGYSFQASVGNVGDWDSTVLAFQKVRTELGPVDVLVNNAGITRDNLLMRMKDEDWQAILDTNLTSVYRSCKAVMRGMMKARKGRIVNIASVIGLTGNAGQANYAAAKAGIIAFSKSLAKEIGSRGVTVNAICPGYINTEMVQAVPKEVLDKNVIPLIPAGRLGEADEIARCVVFLASEDAGFITGSTITANGGQYFA
jgi:acetoacetyl-CoA reductase